MIQRQRADIREYLREDTPFPERESTETAYRLTPAYRELFDDVMAFARDHVADPKLSSVHRRVRWWSAIALLRCLASSPAAAEQTLLNRSAVAAADSTDDVDAFAEPRVLDTDLDDTLEGEDTALGLRHRPNPTCPPARPGDACANWPPTAAALKGPRTDAKLKRLIPLLHDLLTDGYHPIVFCRYIPTADYLAEHLTTALSAKHPGLRIEAVTGTLPPEEREARVNTLTEHDGPRLLIATDCLSEGINLQDGFTAVVHYDLAWNPTRHEQREGRVDRFGQRAPLVRTVTYYGEDNGIDGIVLEVLIRRHEKIRRATGVSVPVPVDSTTVMKAIWESLLLRGKQADQLTLDFGEATSPTLADQVEVQWTNVARTREGVPVTLPPGRPAPRRGVRDTGQGPPFTRRPRRRRDIHPRRVGAAERPTRRHHRRIQRPHRHRAPRRARPAAPGQKTTGCTSTAPFPSRPGTASSPAPTRPWKRCRATSSTPPWTPTSTRRCARRGGPR